MTYIPFTLLWGPEFSSKCLRVSKCDFQVFKKYFLLISSDTNNSLNLIKRSFACKAYFQRVNLF